MSGRRRTAAWVSASTTVTTTKAAEIQVGDVNLISMCLEVAPDRRVTLSDISLDIFEPPNPWSGRYRCKIAR